MSAALHTNEFASRKSCSLQDNSSAWAPNDDDCESNLLVIGGPCPSISSISCDVLPPYTCTILKTGQLRVKKEMDRHCQPATERRWRNFNTHLHGTLLDFCKRHHHRIVRRYGMQNMQVGWASDYLHHPFVIRAYNTATGEQFLLQTPTLQDMVEWIDCLQAAINISIDLDKRKMPTFVTLARSHYRHHNNLVTLIVNGAKVAVQTCPNRGSKSSPKSTKSNLLRSLFS
ncbi:hypothetical protein BC940DRAFT_293953 [Gongronella butleri]|nr:hypothetical protein BC940DRAFT_293953 [Gongronella butleri]